MKRIKMLPLIALFLICAPGLYAQDVTMLNSPKVTFSAGYGFPSLARNILMEVDGDMVNTSFIGPSYAKAEFMMSDRVGFGINFAYSYGQASFDRQDEEVDSLLYNTELTYKSYSILGRFNVHFMPADSRFDPYAGLGLGYRNSNYAYVSNDPEVGTKDVNGLLHMGMDLTIGVRYYLTDNIGIYGEAGLAKSIMQAGLVIRL